MINNAVIVSGGQKRDSGLHIHVSILPQTCLPNRLPCNFEQSSLYSSTNLCFQNFLRWSRKVPSNKEKFE